MSKHLDINGLHRLIQDLSNKIKSFVNNNIIVDEHGSVTNPNFFPSTEAVVSYVNSNIGNKANLTVQKNGNNEFIYNGDSAQTINFQAMTDNEIKNLLIENNHLE